jgi:uncharacterized protein YdeI (YjbR/CyaY-like superfamily)
MNTRVDEYIGGSQRWPDEMAALRKLLVNCELTEEIKWGKPCYHHEGRNIVIMQEMKDFLALMFFKGALLQDPEGLLEQQGPNSRSARRMCFTSVDDVARSADAVRAYVAEAIDVEEAGLQVDPAPDLVLVEELQDRLDRDPSLKAAFRALTPGRQREYDLYVRGAKQATTRVARVEKNVQKILDGRGLRERNDNALS